MHNQMRNKLLSTKTRLPRWLPDHIDFTDKNTKKTHSVPEYTLGRDSETSFAPEYTQGPRLKGWP